MANATFCWEDPLLLDSQLAADERIVRNAAHDYAQKTLMPRIRDAFRHEQMDAGIFREMGEMGLLGCTLPPAYGGAGLNYVSYGLIAREMGRGGDGDGGDREGLPRCSPAPSRTHWGLTLCPKADSAEAFQ